MNITGLTGVSNLQAQVQDDEDKKQQPQQIPQQPQVQTRADISSQGLDLVGKERSIAGRFDLTNITEDGFKELKTELRESNMISELEAVELTAAFNDAKASMQSLNSNGDMPVNLMNQVEQEVTQAGPGESRLGGVFAMFDMFHAEQV